MYYDDELNRMLMEVEFLDVVDKLVPSVRKDLYGEPFSLYKALSPPALGWDEVKYGVHRPELGALRESIERWASDWNLTADWCKASAYRTLQTWTFSPEPGAALHHAGLSMMVERYPPPEGLPQYRQEFGRKFYLDEIKAIALQILTDDPVLKHGEASHRASFIESIISDKRIIDYCDSVESGLTKAGRRQGSKHLTWAVRVHVKGDTRDGIAKETQSEGDGSVTLSAVSHAVKSILASLQLID